MACVLGKPYAHANFIHINVHNQMIAEKIFSNWVQEVEEEY